jgi:drug/metabolite transporter (DMT)-like permease
MHYSNNFRIYFYPILILVLLGIIWGSGYSIAKLAMQNGVPPLGYAFWQSLGPAIVLSVLAVLQKQPLQLKQPNIIYYFICGLLGIALPNTNMYFTAPHLPAGILAVIINITPILIYILSLGLRVERFKLASLIGIIAAVLGIMLILIPKASLSALADIPWAVQALATPLCFAISIIYIARQQMNDSPLTQAAGMLLCSAILLTPLIISTHAFYPLTTFNFPAFLIILEVILSSIGYILLFHLLKIAGPIFYSLVSSIVALTGLFWGWLIFAEYLNLWSSLAVVLIIIGITLVSLQQAKSQN